MVRWAGVTAGVVLVVAGLAMADRAADQRLEAELVAARDALPPGWLLAWDESDAWQLGRALVVRGLSLRDPRGQEASAASLRCVGLGLEGDQLTHADCTLAQVRWPEGLGGPTALLVPLEDGGAPPTLGLAWQWEDDTLQVRASFDQPDALSWTLQARGSGVTAELVEALSASSEQAGASGLTLPLAVAEVAGQPLEALSQARGLGQPLTVHDVTVSLSDRGFVERSWSRWVERKRVEEPSADTSRSAYTRQMKLIAGTVLAMLVPDTARRGAVEGLTAFLEQGHTVRLTVEAASPEGWTADVDVTPAVLAEHFTFETTHHPLDEADHRP